mgnify:CR=1 FL=1
MNATMSSEITKHYPVMLNQILSIISPQHGGTFIDCTFGGGGYSEAILKYPNTKVLGIDRDNLAKSYANKLLKKFPTRFTFFQNKFSNINKFLKLDTKPKAIIFDLGISSLQLADHDRGFSFKSKGSLDMQMGINKYSAYEVVNILDKKKLENIIKTLGEEKDGKLIAKKIVNYRKIQPIKTPEELSNIIKEAKKKYGNFSKNPATQTFQAIRIFVNQELTELVFGLIEATKILPEDGILLVVSFHSLEDRIVKNFFNLYSNLKKNNSRYLPIIESKPKIFKQLSKKPLTPSIKEVGINSNSRSAKLRYAIRSENNLFNPNEFKKKFQNYFNIEGMRL